RDYFPTGRSSDLGVTGRRGAAPGEAALPVRALTGKDGRGTISKWLSAAPLAFCLRGPAAAFAARVRQPMAPRAAAQPLAGEPKAWRRFFVCTPSWRPAASSTGSPRAT